MQPFVQDTPPSTDPIEAWFCIRTQPKHEHIAAAHLGQIDGVEVFNPQLRIERLTRRGRMHSTESLFANYLFARFLLASMLERVRHTPAVKLVVQFGQQVATVPDAVIADLQQTMAAHVDTIFTDLPLEGDTAEIGAGPFQGEQGVVMRVLPARQRVELLLNIMGRSLPAEFSFSSLVFKGHAAGFPVIHASPEDAEILRPESP